MPLNAPLPPYTVRHSRRARRASIRILPGKGVEVVLPVGVDSALAPALIRGKRQWIDTWMRRLRLDTAVNSILELPREIELPAVNARHAVHYENPGPSSPARPLTLYDNAGVLQFVGGPSDREVHFMLLRQWLKQRGRMELVPWLRQLSQRHDLPCGAVQVRTQRTRWGSCSSRGTISLNAALLFLPPELVRHVLLHELCHTLHLDHSPDFWRALERLEPRTKELESRLNNSWRLPPAWILPPR
jgi:predicted metal-dependent hydrolase